MDSLNNFNYSLSSGKKIYNLENFVSDASSNATGNLEKWTALDSEGRLIYIKTHSKSYLMSPRFECENECFVSEYFELLGLPSVKYYLDTLIEGGVKKKICYSYDFVCGKRTEHLLSFMPNLMKLRGVERFEFLKSNCPYLISELNKILIMDFLIQNDDRHLRNIQLVFNKNGSIEVPSFDNGNCLFYDRMDSELLMLINRKLSSCKCRPFFNNWEEQVKILDFSKVNLIYPNPNEVYKLCRKYYSILRSKLITAFLISRLEQFKVFGGKVR